MARHIAWYARRTPDEVAIVENAAIVTYRTMANDLVRCVRAIEALTCAMASKSGSSMRPAAKRPMARPERSRCAA